MVPLWEAAKKTVDGGIDDLNEIIRKRKRIVDGNQLIFAAELEIANKSKEEQQNEILKLRCIAKDLQLISTVIFF